MYKWIELTAALCPSRVLKSKFTNYTYLIKFPDFKSHIFIELSFEQLAIKWSLNLTSRTGKEWPESLCNIKSDWKSQIIIVESDDPVTIYLFVYWRQRTDPSWPERVFIHSFVSRDQNFIVLSLDPDSRIKSSYWRQ